MKRKRYETAGFTLLELVVVAMLLSIILIVLFRTLNTIQASGKLIDNQRSAGKTAQVVLARLIREFSSRYQLPLSGDQQNIPPAGANQGGFNNNQAFLLGEDQETGKSDTDSIRFVTEGFSGDTFGNPGVVEVAYSLHESTSEELRGGYRPYVLVREEVPWGVSEKDTAEKFKKVQPIAENIVSLNFRYFGNDSWKSTWNESNQLPPLAVEITLKVLGSSGQVETYRTAVALGRKRGTSRRAGL